MLDLTVSLVLFQTNEHELIKVLELLLKDKTLSKEIYLVDNSPNDDLGKINFPKDVVYIFNNKNIGYGAGHNIAIKKSMANSKYHLIINSDIDFEPEILKVAFNYLEANQHIAMISPKILFPDGKIQRSYRKLPTPFDLIARRFIPVFLHPFFKQRLDDYLLFHTDDSKTMNVPNLPGCFMYIRTEILNQVNGFDENFFMYVEDIDLTRRLHEIAETLYYPKIVIIHTLARGSRKFSKLLWYHISSAVHYFNKWGWFFDKRRSQINKKL